MKRRINLLSITFTKRNISLAIGDVRGKAIIVLIVLIIGCIAELFTYFYINGESEKFNKSQIVLTRYLEDNKNIDSQIKYFIYKYGLLNKYLKEDANSYFYYTKVQTLLTEAAPTGRLKLFHYKNTGEATFDVSFVNFEDASALLNAIETPEFIKNFEYIKLQGFDAVSKDSKQEFVLSIEAKIIKEDDT